MKLRWKAPILSILTYSGLCIGSALGHHSSYQEGRRISKNPNYPVEFRDAAREYADSELELLSFPKFLNPLATGKQKPYETIFRLKERPPEEAAADGL